jgi:hypothetical protein
MKRKGSKCITCTSYPSNASFFRLPGDRILYVWKWYEISYIKSGHFFAWSKLCWFEMNTLRLNKNTFYWYYHTFYICVELSLFYNAHLMVRLHYSRHRAWLERVNCVQSIEKTMLACVVITAHWVLLHWTKGWLQ